MTTRQRKLHTELDNAHTQLGQAAIRIFAANDRLNQILIEHLNPALWKANPPANLSANLKAGPPASARTRAPARSIAAIFTHMHNVRTKWIRLNAPHRKVPAQLNRAQCTPRQARTALAESAARCTEMLAEAIDGDGRVNAFLRDGWARPWPPGPEMLCYMLAHEAHHRGQVCMLAHQLGFPLPNQMTSRMWNWEKLWMECGSPTGPGEPALEKSVDKKR